jgi:anti-sigma factor RsiW
MSNLLQQLENNEAILLMFLAGELPEDDRIEVEQMLASDPALRRALEELAALHDGIGDTFASADAAIPLARRESVVRSVARSMAARDGAAARQPAVSEARPSRFHIAWWVYPVAAAAMLVVAMVLMSDNRPAALPPAQPTAPDYYAVDTSDTAVPTATAQIFPDELETELISLNSDGDRLFGPNTMQDLDR